MKTLILKHIRCHLANGSLTQLNPHLNHTDGLNNTGGERTKGSAIHKGLDSGLYTKWFSFLLVPHFSDAETI